MKRDSRKTNWGGHLKEYMPLSLRDWFVFFLVIGIASLVCMLLRHVSTSDVHVPMIFVLATLIISVLTEGYFYGFLASIVSVITVNFAFTFPYNQLDFSLYGYPLTFVTMLAVSFVVSTLMARLKKQHQIRLESEKEAVRANLLRAVSHDMRTPLTSISGSLTTILEDEGRLSEETRKELLTDARQNADWLCRMVENLLSVTRIREGEAEHLNKQPELLEEVIGEAVTKFRKRTSGITVSAEIPPDPLFIPMDGILIEQVILNLLDNAAEHGKKTTEIQVKAAQNGNEVIVSVEDNGEGFSSEKKEGESLFECMRNPVRHGKNSSDTSARGIGLSVCRTIIQVHGGRIWAENIPGKGVAVRFSLPVAEQTDD